MIEKVNIAGIKTKIDTDNKKFLSSLSPFAYDFRNEPDIYAKVVDIELKSFVSKYKGIKQEEAKKRLLAESFFGSITEFGGFGLRCNVVSTETGNAYLIVAKSEQMLKQFINNICYNTRRIIDNGYMITAIKKENDDFFFYTTPWTEHAPVNVKLPVTNIIIVSDDNSERSYLNAMQRLLEVMLMAIVIPQKGDTLGNIIELIEMMAQKGNVDFVNEKEIEKTRNLIK